MTGPAQAGAVAGGEAARLFVTASGCPVPSPNATTMSASPAPIRPGMLTIGLAGYSGGKMAGLVSAGEE